MTEYKSTPCPICGRYKVRLKRQRCSGCDKRIQLKKTGPDLKENFQEHRKIDISKITAIDHNRLSDFIYKEVSRKKGLHSIIDLADKFDCSPSKIRSAIDGLNAKGYLIDLSDGMVELHKTIPQGKEEARIDVSKLSGERFVVGALADQHLCSKYARLDVLNALYDIWENSGVTTVYQCGNALDGEASFNRFDLITRPGFEAQIEYFIDKWPQRNGITTHFVTGHDHEGWYVKDFGVNIGQIMQDRAEKDGRQDIKWLGHIEHDIVYEGSLGKSSLRIMHAGGGSAYAHSYSSQKYAESLQGGTKPALCLIGHFHKYNADSSRGIMMIQVGSTQDQTPFLRQRRIESVIGGCTVSYEVTNDGLITNVGHIWHNFYDRAFYDAPGWKYIWK